MRHFGNSVRQRPLLAILCLLLTAGLALGAVPGQVQAQTTPAQPTQAKDDDGPESGAIDSLDDLEKAVVQIEAYGSFVDPSEGRMLNAAGAGSGFIIDQSGLAVTNNHVVTGAAFLKVRVAGEERPRSAKVLGVSECADLAVIDIEGDGYPYLEWYEEPIRVGLDVYAAGFPLGEPEFTLTRGIVSKAQANGDTNWASVSAVLQHDATINPGNSGGPLVTAEGRVVGVNYAGDSSTARYFAISRDEVLSLVDTLKEGTDVDAIGINGQAIRISEDAAGIWVASVKSGSPADRTGIRPGDILFSMEGLLLAQDGTMADYCNILRSHEQDDVLSVRVLRSETQEVLTGRLNGRPLEPSFVYGQLEEDVQPQNEPSESGGSSEETAGYADYTVIHDDSNVLSIEVPTAWDDVNAKPWMDDETELGPALAAAADLDSYYNGWSEPGVFVGASKVMATRYDSPEAYLETYDFSESCSSSSRKEYTYDAYTGLYNVWEGCGDDDSLFFTLAMMPETNDRLIVVDVLISSDADLDALDHILTSLSIEPPSAAAPPAENAGAAVDTAGLDYSYSAVEGEAVSLLLPDTWTDTDSRPWEVDNETIGQIFQAAPDIQGYNESWKTPGLVIYTSQNLAGLVTPEELLDKWQYSEYCDFDQRLEHEHSSAGLHYTGAYDVWTNCGGTDTSLIVLAAVPDLLDHMVVMEFQIVDQADEQAFGVAGQSFAAAIETASSGTSDNQTDASTSPSIDLSDPWSLLSVKVPVPWTDQRAGLWTIDDEVVGIRLMAAPDLDGFENDWNTPGLFYGVSAQLAQTLTVEEGLDSIDFKESCTYGDRFAYEDSLFTGAYDLWVNCGGMENYFMVLVTTPKVNSDVLMLLQVQTGNSQPEKTFDLVTSSFNLNRDIDIDDLATEIAKADTSTATDEGRALPETGEPIAVVLVNALNVRGGPGTNYSRIGGVGHNDRLRITGAQNNCSWLQVRIPDGTLGWVSGRPQYVRFTVPCGQIPTAPVPPAPSTPQAPAAGTNAATNSTQGCYLFQNHLNAELTVTFTSQDRDWNQTFKVGAKDERAQCFEPGHYTYTLDAPPPWGSTNGELDVNAGDRYNFPISGE